MFNANRSDIAMGKGCHSRDGRQMWDIVVKKIGVGGGSRLPEELA
jgi:hypothetical protein